MKDDDFEIIGSGNAFRDAGLPNPEMLQAKSDVTCAIRKSIRRQGLSQRKAAEVTGLSQPAVNQLAQGDFTGYTFDRLWRTLKRLEPSARLDIRYPRAGRSRTRQRGSDTSRPDARR